MIINQEASVIIKQKGFTVETKSAEFVYSFWLDNLDQIKKIISNGSDYLSISMVSTYALCEAISFNLFGKSARYYFGEKVLKIPKSDLLYEAFRNGFTHSFQPNRLQYNDSILTWAWSSDTSPSGFREYYPGEKDPSTGGYIFKPDTVFEYIEFSKEIKQISVSLDRLLAMVEADLKNRKSMINKTDKFNFIVGKKFDVNSPPGALKATESM